MPPPDGGQADRGQRGQRGRRPSRDLHDSRYRPDRRVVLGRTVAGRRLKVVLTNEDPPAVITVADRDVEE
jgi:hypothetical protein